MFVLFGRVQKITLFLIRISPKRNFWVQTWSTAEQATDKQPKTTEPCQVQWACPVLASIQTLVSPVVQMRPRKSHSRSLHTMIQWIIYSLHGDGIEIQLFEIGKFKWIEVNIAMILTYPRSFSAGHSNRFICVQCGADAKQRRYHECYSFIENSTGKKK